MNTFYWLVKREFWEHRGSFLWTPVIIAGVVVIINILSLIAGEAIGGNAWNSNLIGQKLATASPDDLRQLGSLLDVTSLVPAMIVSIALFFVLFSYCMKNLSSDRNDRSILFWKSMPVSDLATVLSKVFSAVVLAPVIAVIVSAIAAFLMLLTLAVAAALHGVGFGEILWGLPHPGRIALYLFGLLPIYMVWMLPSVGWLMLCSAWTKGRTARWALGLPFALGGIAVWLSVMADNMDAAAWYWKHIALRIAFGVAPGSWTWINDFSNMPGFTFESGSPVEAHGFSSILSQAVSAQYALLATPNFLWGVLAGAVMIAIAVWLRRWRTEL